MGKKINVILNLQDKFTKGLSDAEKRALLFKNQLNSCSKVAEKFDTGLVKLAKTARNMSLAGGAAIAGFAKVALDEYKNFEQSMAKVAGVLSLDKNSEVYKNLETSAREAGKTTTKTAQESADALYYMALAGWSAEDSMKSLMPVLRASEATGADLATTSDLITDSMSALSIETSKLQEYLDMGTKANNISNQTLLQLMEVAINCGGAFKVMGADMYALGTASSILADVGKKGTEAGTALNSIVTRISANKTAIKEFGNIGVNVFDDKGAYREFRDILIDTDKALSKLNDEARATSLKNIAGTHYFSTFEQLLEATREGSARSKEFANRWDEINSQLHNSSGALDSMATTMNDTLTSSFAIAKSAFSDFLISTGSQLAPYVKNFLDWFSEKMPNATEKFRLWLDNKIPKATRKAQTAFKLLSSAVKFISKNFVTITGVAIGLVTAMKSFSIITKIVSLYGKITKATSLWRAAQLALNTSFLACPITWIAIGIGAVAGAVYATGKNLKEADIAKRFGDITLSMEDCSKVVRNFFGEELIRQVEEINSATEKFNSSLEATTTSASKLNSLNFRIKFNGSVTKEEYEETAKEYIENLQNTINDKHYAISLQLDLLLDGNRFKNEFKTDTNEFYGELTAQMQALGEDLAKAYNEAFEKNWNVVSTEAVMDNIQKMSEIQNKLEEAKSNARLEALKSDFAKGDLSKESFENLITASNEELTKLQETYNQARIDGIAQASLNYGEGSEQYLKAVEQLNAEYQKKVGGLYNKEFDFINDSIYSAYPEIKEEIEKLDDEVKKIIEDYKNSIDLSDGLNRREISTFRESLLDSFRINLRPEVRKQIKEYYAIFEEELQKYYSEAQKGNTAVNGETLLQSLLISSTSKTNFEMSNWAQKKVGNALLAFFAPDLKSDIEKRSGENMEAFARGIDNGTSKVKNAFERFKEKVKGWFSEPMEVGATVDLTAKAVGPQQSSGVGTPFSVNKSNATGTSYFGGGWTRINENGGEIINLPTGSQIIPADKSEKMVQGEKNINVSINVQGHIFGIDNAVEIIGSKVCEKLYDSLNAV